MKLAGIIGRVTLNTREASYAGGRFLVALPWHPDHGRDFAKGKKLAKGNSFIVYDNLGASVGDVIAYSDGGEAAAAFEKPTPCDAYCCAIIDKLFHNSVQKV